MLTKKVSSTRTINISKECIARLKALVATNDRRELQALTMAFLEKQEVGAEFKGVDIQNSIIEAMQAKAGPNEDFDFDTKEINLSHCRTLIYSCITTKLNFLTTYGKIKKVGSKFVKVTDDFTISKQQNTNENNNNVPSLKKRSQESWMAQEDIKRFIEIPVSEQDIINIILELVREKDSCVVSRGEISYRLTMKLAKANGFAIYIASQPNREMLSRINKDFLWRKVNNCLKQLVNDGKAVRQNDVYNINLEKFSLEFKPTSDDMEQQNYPAFPMNSSEPNIETTTETMILTTTTPAPNISENEQNNKGNKSAISKLLELITKADNLIIQGPGIEVDNQLINLLNKFAKIQPKVFNSLDNDPAYKSAKEKLNIFLDEVVESYYRKNARFSAREETDFPFPSFETKNRLQNLIANLSNNELKLKFLRLVSYYYRAKGDYYCNELKNYKEAISFYIPALNCLTNLLNSNPKDIACQTEYLLNIYFNLTVCYLEEKNLTEATKYINLLLDKVKQTEVSKDYLDEVMDLKKEIDIISESAVEESNKNDHSEPAMKPEKMEVELDEIQPTEEDGGVFAYLIEEMEAEFQGNQDHPMRLLPVKRLIYLSGIPLTSENLEKIEKIKNPSTASNDNNESEGNIFSKQKDFILSVNNKNDAPQKKNENYCERLSRILVKLQQDFINAEPGSKEAYAFAFRIEYTFSLLCDYINRQQKRAEPKAFVRESQGSTKDPELAYEKKVFNGGQETELLVDDFRHHNKKIKRSQSLSSYARFIGTYQYTSFQNDEFKTNPFYLHVCVNARLLCEVLSPIEAKKYFNRMLLLGLVKQPYKKAEEPIKAYTIANYSLFAEEKEKTKKRYKRVHKRDLPVPPANDNDIVQDSNAPTSTRDKRKSTALTTQADPEREMLTELAKRLKPVYASENTNSQPVDTTQKYSTSVKI